MIQANMISTSFTVEGQRIVEHRGIVRGISVRSRSIIGNIGASLQQLVGGNITILRDLCEKTRLDALLMMAQHAEQMGANAVIGVRYDANEIMQGVAEVICYGTAVVVVPQTQPPPMP
ncbi:MAG: YbjQ family protein [Kiritimatiellaeota bacterium]|nr:YbjQ family protein [Kiritimatiellota bacterium]